MSGFLNLKSTVIQRIIVRLAALRSANVFKTSNHRSFDQHVAIRVDRSSLCLAQLRQLGCSIWLRKSKLSSRVLTDTIPSCPLCISIDVHFDNTVADRLPWISSSEEPEPPWNTKFRALGAIPELLQWKAGGPQESGKAANVTSLVNTVQATKEAAIWNGLTAISFAVCIRLLEKCKASDASISDAINAVFFTTSTTKFDFDCHVHFAFMRSRYLVHVSMFLRDSSERSSMWEENRGLPASAKNFSPASSRPSIHGSSFLSKQRGQCVE